MPLAGACLLPLSTCGEAAAGIEGERKIGRNGYNSLVKFEIIFSEDVCVPSRTSMQEACGVAVNTGVVFLWSGGFEGGTGTKAIQHKPAIQAPTKLASSKVAPWVGSVRMILQGGQETGPGV